MLEEYLMWLGWTERDLKFLFSSLRDYLFVEFE